MATVTLMYTKFPGSVTFSETVWEIAATSWTFCSNLADRKSVAKPGSKNYSRLSVTIYYRAKCELLETISKNCFKPKPKVDSCMIKIIPRKKPPFMLIDEKKYFDLVRKLFIHRRKKIKNTLNMEYGLKIKDTPYLDCRVDQLTPEQIGELSDFVSKNIQ